MPAETDSFVHLHLHTQYSMLDGATRIKPLMAKAQEFGMPAVAMTDHGVLFGVPEFHDAAKNAGITPIIGCEVYMAPGDRREKTTRGDSKSASFHLTLLTQSFKGYQNLTKLVSAAHLEGFYYKPRIDRQLLAQYSADLICLSGCLQGELCQAIISDNLDEARKTIGWYKDVFGPDRYYLEMHDHGIEAQTRANRQILEFRNEFGLDVVAANDVHFLNAADHDSHDVMICIGTGKQIFDERRMRYPGELYFKSPREMRELFRHVPEACDNTLKIAEMVDIELDTSNKYPEFDPPEGKTREGYLRELCLQGLAWRYGERAENDPEVKDRLEYELSVIEKMGFVSYFLIVSDFIRFAREKNIPVGPGRGSAAGSLVAYVLGITDLDPLQFGLIFERFLNPERVSPPDIDIDFCQSRRGEVIDYVRRKYGERNVSHIVTFGTMGAKSVVRDVGRVMGLSYTDADRIAKMIPNELKMTLEKAVEMNPDLAAALQNEPTTAELWQHAKKLEGLSRNTGIHAAGVVISDRELDTMIPLKAEQSKDDDGNPVNVVITQYPMTAVEEFGLLKMDFLGLKTLTVIHDAVELIDRKEPNFDLGQISYTDEPTLDLLNSGDTVGVFQLESGGMQDLCRKFNVEGINDIVALIALYRPGPMDLIPNYIKRKKGETKVVYEHPLLEEVSKETFGVMIYQEQVQRAANVLAGYSLGEADLLRRAMGKKKVEVMQAERKKFVEGCKRVNDIPADKANAIFDLLEKFAGYGFNKSHSAAYGLISFQTAYLKANYPVEFMCGLLSNEINNTDKISVFVAECKRMGVEILPPDVNKSGLKFVPDQDEQGKIRYGLAGIKNVGEHAMEVVIENRKEAGPFAGLEDFCNRLDTRQVNKKNLESLIKAGAFDFTGRDRAEMTAALDRIVGAAASLHRDRAAGQIGLFDEMGGDSFAAEAESTTVEFDPWTKAETLSYEKDLLGFYVTGHPLDDYRDTLQEGGYHPINAIGQVDSGSFISIAGMATDVQRRFTKAGGKPFAIVTLEDMTGSMEVMIWSETIQKFGRYLQQGRVLALRGKVTRKGDDEEVRFGAEEILDLQTSCDTTPLVLRFEMPGTEIDDLEEVQIACRRHPGKRPLYLQFNYPDGRRLTLRAGGGLLVQLDEILERKLAPYLPNGDTVEEDSQETAPAAFGQKPPQHVQSV